jgi:hypothetical protein
MPLSKYSIEAMDFTKITNGMEIEATFSLVRVYQVKGISLKEFSTNSLANLCYKDQEIAFGLGNSLNEVYNYMCNEKFDEHEEQWMQDNETVPPFLIIQINLNKSYTCKSGYWKKDKVNDEEIVVTYDCFSEAKRQLKDKDEKNVPLLISSLAVHFSSLNQPVRFKPIFREIFGKTSLGNTIVDVRIDMSATISISRSVNPSEIKTKIQDSLKLYSQLDYRIASLFHAALEETNRLKTFLHLFFVLERYTHQVFQEIDFQKCVIKADSIPDRVKVSGEKLFLELQVENKTPLELQKASTKPLLRFQWCALLVWEKISDQDIEDFKSLKKIRDKLSHGENVPEATLPVDLAEKLCLKLLSSHS